MSFIMFLSLSTCFAISSLLFYNFSAGLAFDFFLTLETLKILNDGRIFLILM